MDTTVKQAEKLLACSAGIGLGDAPDFHYFKSFPEYKAAVDGVQGDIQSALLACQAAVAPKTAKPTAVDWEDAAEVCEWVGGAIDDCCEGVDAAIDRHRQAVRQQALGQEDALSFHEPSAPMQALPSQLAPVSASGGTPKGLLRNMQAGSQRPQELFQLPVDNSLTPFQHRAPHLPVDPATPDGLALQHPYAHALEQLSYAPSHLQATEVIPPRPLEETELAWVDTPEALTEMVSELQGVEHLAIDLEHHSYRSFQGFTCLMQLSSRTKDYVVDTLALRKQLGPALIGIFANPEIVKVLHGADHDVLWLQRDFHLHLVNMFDTGQASRVLSYPSNSLAFLLEHFCDIKADKRFQLADWRARPLSPEMLHYARGDTHCLLYCYDRLKQELIEMSDQVPPSLQVPIPPQQNRGCLALATVLERSRRLCLSMYEKPAPLTRQACDDMVQRWELSLTSLQRSVLHAAAVWRDGVCRELDESTGYVLPRSQLITVAQQMPDTAKDLLRLLGRSASEVLRSRANDLAACIACATADTAAVTAGKEANAAAALTAAVVHSAGAPVSNALLAPSQQVIPPSLLSDSIQPQSQHPLHSHSHSVSQSHSQHLSLPQSQSQQQHQPLQSVSLAPKAIAPIKSKAGSRGGSMLGGPAPKRPRVDAVGGVQRPMDTEATGGSSGVQPMDTDRAAGVQSTETTPAAAAAAGQPSSPHAHNLTQTQPASASAPQQAPQAAGLIPDQQQAGVSGLPQLSQPAAASSVPKIAGRAKSRGSMAGLLSKPTATPPLKHTSADQQSTPQADKAAAQLRASFALPFPQVSQVLAPPSLSPEQAGEAAAAANSTPADVLQPPQAQQLTIQQPQQDGRISSMDYVPIPCKARGARGSHQGSHSQDNHHHQQNHHQGGGISQGKLPRDEREALKQKYIQLGLEDAEEAR